MELEAGNSALADGLTEPPAEAIEEAMRSLGLIGGSASSGISRKVKTQAPSDPPAPATPAKPAPTPVCTMWFLIRRNDLRLIFELTGMQHGSH